MKRNEMVKLMYDAAYACYVSSEQSGMQVMSDVLHKMRLAGMLPPQIVNPEIKQMFPHIQNACDYADLVTAGRNCSKPVEYPDYYINAWEYDDEADC